MHLYLPWRIHFWWLGWTTLIVLGTPATLEAAPFFPRGPGFYFDPYKLGALAVGFLAWVKLCAWVDKDAKLYRFDPVFWNGMLLGSGMLGFLLLWNLPLFWPVFILIGVAICSAAYGYLSKRNRRADAEDQLFNDKHFWRLYEKYLGARLKRAPGVKVESTRALPIRFMSRSTTGGEAGDAARVEKVQESKGYKAALEMVWDALEKRATDIHLEPTKTEMNVRFRIDGMMNNLQPFPRATGDAVVSIFKVIANIDISEKRIAQDGSFSAQIEDRLVEFRVATAGSVVGEKMVMRILDSSAQLANLSHVGMTEDMQAAIRDVITKPHGLCLVCGPTGSGKSTTLYACLHEIDRFAQNIITVENPVEYRLDGITQIEINPKAGKTFASELRSILRQDPDVILIGEIRDKETAEIACQAAQTGHLVFSTLHANDSVTAIARLIDLGVPPFMLSTALLAVLSQRLVRKLCKKCRKKVKPSTETLRKLKADPDEVSQIFRANEVAEEKEDEDKEDADESERCTKCGGTGYFKRTGIFDLLVLNDKIRDLIRENPDVQEIRKAAVATGLKSLFDDGSRLVIAGETSIQELLRVAK